MNKIKGLTLVELMVALVVGLVLVSGVMQIFVNSLHTSRVQEALSRIQENGRFALELIAKEVRMAGYQGCEGVTDLDTSIIADTPPAIDFGEERAIFGFEQASLGNWLPATGGFATALDATVFTTDLASARVGSDVLFVQRASENSASLTGNMSAVNANIQINENIAEFNADDILFITDCESADIFKATNVSQSGGKVTIAHSESSNSSNNLSKAYGPDAMVMSMTQLAFFVQDTGRVNEAAQPIYSLYWRNLTGTVQELFEGVESIQVLYGEDTDGDLIANRYVDASSAGLSFSDVVSVRVGLLVTSNEAIASANDNRTYSVGNVSIGPAGGNETVQHAIDRRIRKVFSTTIQLRNRGLSS